MDLRFENDVKKYGTQTAVSVMDVGYSFENDVKKYGIQTEAYDYGEEALEYYGNLEKHHQNRD